MWKNDKRRRERIENDREVLENRRNEIGSLKRDLETLRAENIQYSKILAEKQSRIKDEMLTRFQLIVKDLDLMKEARDWMMSHLELLISLGKGIDEGFDET
ncbi:hypothetical protein ANCCAN_19344 [Ancylostoma caninum]|uniref:Uncharacterized protein n=1 Tax=Ancylostoma caninum TaxID=29170 RepID=A0A368FTK9_ANCCA|nr:hypothetical protein ANCCAN_19344 [Ancylostoma caninum]